MTNTHATDASNPTSVEDLSLETCQAVLVCLNTRRFVVAWYDQPRDLWPINGGWQRLRELKPGDQVVYKGNRTTVRALAAYR